MHSGEVRKLDAWVQRGGWTSPLLAHLKLGGLNIDLFSPPLFGCVCFHYLLLQLPHGYNSTFCPLRITENVISVEFIPAGKCVSSVGFGSWCNNQVSQPMDLDNGGKLWIQP